jgi:hypothetical protein
MNKKLFERIAAVIEQAPEDFDMSSWEGRRRNEDGEICGTTHCIAGWAIVLSTGQNFLRQWSDYPEKVSNEAARLLEISEEQADSLFHVFSWPGEFKHNWLDNDDQGQAKTGIARIRHFMETGE